VRTSTRLEEAELIYSGQAFAVKVTELDFEKSPEQLALEGGSGSPDNGSTMFGPYASESDAERDAVRARIHYEARKHVNQWGETELDWRVEVVPWPVPKHRDFSSYVAEQEARAQGVRPEEIDLRLVFNEPIEIQAPGPRSRPSALAERQQS
jgi:hypothetical protein